MRFIIIISVLVLCFSAIAPSEAITIRGVDGGSSTDHAAPGRDACGIASNCPLDYLLPGGVAYDGTYIWLAFYFDTSRIFQIDPESCSVVHSIPGPTSPGIAGLAWDGQTLWACHEQNGTIYQLDPTDGTIMSEIPAPGHDDSDPNSAGLAFDGTYLWHADYGHNMIYKLDPADGAILDSFASPGNCASGLGYLASGEVLVLADCYSHEIYIINPADGNITSSCGAASGHPWGLAWMSNLVWSGDLDTLYLLDVNQGTVATEEHSWDGLKALYR